MQLLPPQQVQSSVNAEEALRISRIKDLRKSEEELRISLARADAEFQKTLSNNLKIWAEESDKHQEEVRKMKKETERLMAEQISYAIPYDILKEGDEDRMRFAQELLARVKKQEKDNEQTKDLLEEKLTEVSMKSDELVLREQRIQVKEEHAAKIMKESQDAQEKLSLAVIKFNEDSAAKRTELQARETEATLKEKTLHSREKGLEGREQDMENRERKLKDDRAVLERAWNELKRNHSPS